MRKLTRSEIYAAKQRMRQFAMARGEPAPTVFPKEWYESYWKPKTLFAILKDREAIREPKAFVVQTLTCPVCNWHGRGLKMHMRRKHWTVPHYEIVEKLTALAKTIDDTNKYNAILVIIELFSKTTETKNLPRLALKEDKTQDD